METRAHRRLKRLAVWFLRGCGHPAAAIEVRCPISNYRLDAAGWADRAPKARASPRNNAWNESQVGRQNAPRKSACNKPHTIIIECKQQRSDFLRDNHQTEALLKRRRALSAIRQAIETERIPREEPHLRLNGSSLFPELDEWDYASSALPGYRKLLRTLQHIDEQIHGRTKFHRLGHYRLADQLYVLAPRGMVRPCELPPHWGLLECPPGWLDEHASRDRLEQAPLPHVVVEAPALNARMQHRLRLLRNIAVAASRAAVR